MQELLKLLLWTADQTDSGFDLPSLDVPYFLSLAASHHLTVRLFHRLQRETPSWATVQLRTSLQQAYVDIQTKLDAALKILQHIYILLAEDAPPPIITKGFTTYALSGKPNTLRIGGDIDIFYPDLTYLEPILLQLGFQQSKAPFLYEIGGYSRGEIEIDIHAYFPLYTYGKEQKMPFDHLLRNAQPGNTQETRRLLFPDINRQIIIYCAHAFRHYVDFWSISSREKPIFPLGELLDIFELCHDPTFQKASFLQLVQEYQAETAVTWVASVAMSLLGKNPLPVAALTNAGESLPAAHFPRCLWWNFWYPLTTPTEHLLISGIPDLTAIVNQLGGNFLLIEHQYSNHSPYGQPFDRLLTQGRAFPIALFLKRTDSTLEIDLSVDTLLQRPVQRVRLDWGSSACEWIMSKDATSSIGTPIAITSRKTHRGYDLHISFSLGSFSQHQSTAFLLGIAQQQDLYHPDPDTVLLPFILLL